MKRDIHPFSGIEKGHWSNIFSSGVFEPIVHFVTKFNFCLQGLDIMQKSYLEALIFLINISDFLRGYKIYVSYKYKKMEFVGISNTYISFYIQNQMKS